MALINRIARLFKADVNAVLDQIEEPEIILRQAIRDMEEELASCEIRIATRTHEQQTLKESERDIVKTISEFDKELDLCFEAGKDDLAKSLVRRKLQATRTATQFASRIQSNQGVLEKERRALEENRTTLEELRQKAEIFLSEEGKTNTPGRPDSGGLSISGEEIEIAFLREQAARSVS